MSKSTQKNYLVNLIAKKEKQLESDGFITFDQADLKQLKKKDVQVIEKQFHGRAMMELPAEEVNFFKWLKENDPPVWDDLWKNVEEPYRVSIDFLHHFVEDGNGFPICDLVKADNYWFHSRHIKPKATEKMDEIQQKLDSNKSLSLRKAY